MKKQDKFWEIFEQYRDQLWKYILHFRIDYNDAKDVMSETMLITYYNFEKINDKRAILSYFITTARRLIYRYKKNYKQNVIDTSIEIDKTISLDLCTYKYIQYKELYSALEQISVNQKEVIVLTMINGFSYIEASKQMNMSIDNIK